MGLALEKFSCTVSYILLCCSTHAWLIYRTVPGDATEYVMLVSLCTKLLNVFVNSACLNIALGFRQVRFEGSAVLDGIKALPAAGLAESLPSFITDIPSQAKTRFEITTVGDN